MKKFNSYLVDVLLRSTLLISEEEIEKQELSESNLEILEQKLYDKLQSGEWKEDIRFKHDFNAFNDYSGAYSSINDFINKNGLESIADEVWGKDWEPEDDATKVSELLTALNVDNEYIVSVIDNHRIDDDILVTSLKHLPIYKNTFKNYEVSGSNEYSKYIIRNVQGIHDEKFKLQILHMETNGDVYVDEVPKINVTEVTTPDEDGFFTIKCGWNGIDSLYIVREIK